MKAKLLRRLAKSERDIQKLFGEQHVLVQQCREAGATWKEIGEILGITQAAAHARYSGN